MGIVGHARRDCDIVDDNNLLLLFARARAWATLALVDLGPLEHPSENARLKTVQHISPAAPTAEPWTGQQLYSSSRDGLT
jgi:hypothetical protein